jgi:hypothetical protein
VGVGADAGADDDQRPGEALPDRGVHLLRRQQRVLPLHHLHRGEVDQVGGAAVDDEEGEVGAHRLGVHEHRRLQTHLRGELQRGALGPLVVRDRERERHLHHAVAGGVAVRADHGGHAPASRRSVAGLW